MKLWTMALVLTVLVAAPLAAGQTADRVEVLLKATVHQALVDGDLEAAIEQYKDIVARAGGNRAVAAKALLQMGRAYEKLGRSEASAAYERLLRGRPHRHNQEYAEHPNRDAHWRWFHCPSPDWQYGRRPSNGR